MKVGIACLCCLFAVSAWARQVDRTFLRDLLAIPSITADRERVNEAVDLVHRHLAAHGVVCVEEHDADGRKILYASTRPGKVQDYLLVVHLDVVPAESEQFAPRFSKDGRVYARGAHDCKGNAALALQVLERLDGKASVGVIFASDEETGGHTTGAMVSRGYGARKLVIVLDAGTTGVFYAQKGCCCIRVRAIGRGGHSSMPMCLDNPIDKLMVGYTKFRAVWPKAPADGWGDLVSATVISAGDAPNRIPDTAEMTLNLRSVNNDALERAMKLLKDVGGLEVAEVWGLSPPLTSDVKEPEVRRLMLARKATWPERNPGFQRMMAATDARYFATCGTPVVIVGSIGGNAHGRGEWADLRSIDDNAEMLERFVTEESFGRE